jgi:hypothetical protein
VIFDPESLRNRDRELRRPLASLFCEEFFSLGHGAHRFVTVAQWFVHLSTHPQPMQQYRQLSRHRNNRSLGP